MHSSVSFCSQPILTCFQVVEALLIFVYNSLIYQLRWFDLHTKEFVTSLCRCVEFYLEEEVLFHSGV